MYVKTRGLILRQMPYKDNSLIVNVFTKDLGRKAFYVRTGGKKSGKKAAIFMPLSVLNMEVKLQESREIQHLGEVSLHHYPSVFFASPLMSGVGLFMSEILYRTIQSEEVNTEAYNTLETFVIQLDNRVSNLNIHLLFLIELAEMLGFGIVYPDNTSQYFDLEEGRFSEHKPPHSNFLWKQQLLSFLELMRHNKDICITGIERRQFLDKLLLFYKYHIPLFGEIKSLEILKQTYLS
jgi:DNA repair protein RecO (recombination protein O)